MLRKFLLVALIAISGSAFAADADFTLVNRTGHALEKVFLSPANQSKWGRDRLGEYQLGNGESKKFTFGDTKNCKQDIKVVFADDNSEIEWESFNLCELNKITLRYNRKSREVSADSE